MTEKRERELIRRWQLSDDKAAAEELVCATMRHVVPLANRFRVSGEPFDDLVAEACVGVMHALRKYEIGKGTRFATYARYWIRAYLIRYVQRTRSLVSTPLHEPIALYGKARRLRAGLGLRGINGQEATALVATELGMEVDELRLVEHRFGGRDVSLEAPLPGREHSLGDILPSRARTPFNAALVGQLEALLRRGLERAGLDERERFILEERLLSHGGDEPSLAELGRSLNITRERTRQLEKRAKEKLHAALVRIHQEVHKRPA